MSNIVSFPTRSSAITKQRDYLGDREAAQEQADIIRDYYHKRGFAWVDVWVVPPRRSDSGPKDYYIRSNIHFKVPS